MEEHDKHLYLSAKKQQNQYSTWFLSKVCDSITSEIIKLLQQALIVVIADSNLPCQKNWKFLGPSELREFSLSTKREEGTG